MLFVKFNFFIKIIIPMPKSINRVNFSSPTDFKIEVKGYVDKSLSDYLGGLKISYPAVTSKLQISCLQGKIIDQGALMGILTTLYDMRFPILRVEIIGKENANEIN